MQELDDLASEIRGTRKTSVFRVLRNEISDIKKGLDKDIFQIARFGYKYWLWGNREKPTIEKLKFLRDYLKAYENQCRIRL